MSLSQQVVNHPSANQLNGALLEKVLIGNDLSGLNALEKVQYVKNVCHTLGLNPVTKPIQLMKFQGKEIPYFTKDASEQLRKINRVSISNIDTKILDGGVYVVTAYATTPDGRQDSSTGVISITGLKGDNLSNAMMKAETKAKRRVTLSICGLGFIDECEVDSIPHARKVDVIEEQKKEIGVDASIDTADIELYFVDFMNDIEQTENLDQLKNIFDSVKKIDFKNRSDLFKKLVDAKDSRKSALTFKEFQNELNEETGEIS